MKIIYLHQYFNTPEMSGGTRSYEFARRLVGSGHDVYMITSDRKAGGGVRQTVEAGIQVTWLPVPYSNSMNVPARLGAFLKFAYRSARIASKIQADVVFATSTPLTIAIPGVYASKRQKIPMVFEVRDLWPEMPIAMGALRNPVARFAARRLEKFAYRHSARVVALSPGMKDGVVEQGFPAESVSVIPNSCDLMQFEHSSEIRSAFRSRFDWLGDRPLVVYVGTVGRVNGVDYLARVAQSMQSLNPQVRFLVVGDGGDEERVRKIASDLGVLNRNFFMMPGVKKSDVPEVLFAADIATSLFVDVPEMQVNSANKFFDALASGTPVAVNYEGWHAELLRNCNAGVVLDSFRPDVSAELLAEKLSDANWLAEAGNATHRLARQRFDRDLLYPQLEQVLVEAASQRH